MGEKLGKEMVPKLKAMDAKVFGTINAEAQAAMGACLPAPGPPRIAGLAACVFGVRIIFSNLLLIPRVFGRHVGGYATVQH